MLYPGILETTSVHLCVPLSNYLDVLDEEVKVESKRFPKYLPRPGLRVWFHLLVPWFFILLNGSCHILLHTTSFHLVRVSAGRLWYMRMGGPWPYYPFCSARLPGEGRFPQMRSSASLLWHSGQPFGVPDVGNEIIHAHTVTECPSGTQEPCEIEAHRRELTFVMASHQQGCSQLEERILGCETAFFIALFLCLLFSPWDYIHI